VVAAVVVLVEGELWLHLAQPHLAVAGVEVVVVQNCGFLQALLALQKQLLLEPVLPEELLGLLTTQAGKTHLMAVIHLLVLGVLLEVHLAVTVALLQVVLLAVAAVGLERLYLVIRNIPQAVEQAPPLMDQPEVEAVIGQVEALEVLVFKQVLQARQQALLVV